MKKLSLILGVFAAAFIALAGAPEVGAATNWSSTDSLPCAVADGTATGSSCNDEWVLQNDITLAAALTRYNGADTNLTIDLNGHSITTSGAIALVNGPTLTIKDSAGGGYIKSTGGNYGTIYVQVGHLTVESGKLISAKADNGAIIWTKGSDANVANATSVVVGKDAVLEYEAPGYGYGVMVDKTANNNAYGVSITVNGVIGGGLYINGSVQHKDNAPQFTIGSTAVLTSTGAGFPAVYAAGYANWVFEDGATVTGEGSALAIKSGTFLINGGTYTVTGPDSTPTAGFSNGVNASGTTIQIESNASYAGDIELTILGGTFVSENGRVFYEYLADNVTDTAVSELAINGGSFTSDAGKNVFMVSQEFADAITGFVYGGTFSSDPSAYAADGVTFTQNADGTYSTGSETDGEVIPGVDTNPATGDNTILFAAGAGILGLIALGAGLLVTRKS